MRDACLQRFLSSNTVAPFCKDNTQALKDFIYRLKGIGPTGKLLKLKNVEEIRDIDSLMVKLKGIVSFSTKNDFLRDQIRLRFQQNSLPFSKIPILYGKHPKTAENEYHRLLTEFSRMIEKKG